MKIRELFCFVYEVHKENMFTINLGDGREAPSKASYIYFLNLQLFLYLLFKMYVFVKLYQSKILSMRL